MDEIRRMIALKNLENIIKGPILDQRKGLESIIRTNIIFEKRSPHY